MGLTSTPAPAPSEADLAGVSPNWITTRLDELVNWARTGSLWPMPFGTAWAGRPAERSAAPSGWPISCLPVVDRAADGRYVLRDDLSRTIGKVRGFHGVFLAVLKAYAWIMSLGERGLREAANVAVLNNNYILAQVGKIRGASAPFAPGRHRIEQVRYSWEKLRADTGVTTEDVALRMADFGFHLWSSHHPFIVPEPFTIEPTESYSKAEIDEYIAALEKISYEKRNKNYRVCKNRYNWF